MLSLTHIPATPYERAWNGALVARLNVIYYQRLLRSYERLDRWMRIASLLLSSLGVGLAVKYLPDVWAMVAGGVSAALSATTLIAQLPDKARAAGALLPLYVQHHAALARLVMQGEAVDETALAAALTSLDETQVMEAEKIKDVNEDLRREAQRALHEELGASAPSAT